MNLAYEYWHMSIAPNMYIYTHTTNKYDQSYMKNIVHFDSGFITETFFFLFRDT